MIFLLLSAVLLIVFGILFLILYFVKRRKLGILSSTHIYTDTIKIPGEVLYSNTLPLYGKPDYILKIKGALIPVEVKTGKTPRTPYANHISQLIAYCILVSENYGSRPTHGVIKYPQKEFNIPFTKEREESLQRLITEMVEYKTHKRQFILSSTLPYLCYECNRSLPALRR